LYIEVGYRINTDGGEELYEYGNVEGCPVGYVRKQDEA
jgi:hypothetical protein